MNSSEDLVLAQVATRLGTKGYQDYLEAIKRYVEQATYLSGTSYGPWFTSRPLSNQRGDYNTKNIIQEDQSFAQKYIKAKNYLDRLPDPTSVIRALSAASSHVTEPYEYSTNIDLKPVDFVDAHAPGKFPYRFNHLAPDLDSLSGWEMLPDYCYEMWSADPEVWLVMGLVSKKWHNSRISIERLFQINSRLVTFTRDYNLTSYFRGFCIPAGVLEWATGSPSSDSVLPRSLINFPFMVHEISPIIGASLSSCVAPIWIKHPWSGLFSERSHQFRTYFQAYTWTSFEIKYEGERLSCEAPWQKHNPGGRNHEVVAAHLLPLDLDSPDLAGDVLHLVCGLPRPKFPAEPMGHLNQLYRKKFKHSVKRLVNIARFGLYRFVSPIMVTGKGYAPFPKVADYPGATEEFIIRKTIFKPEYLGEDTKTHVNKIFDLKSDPAEFITWDESSESDDLEVEPLEVPDPSW